MAYPEQSESAPNMPDYHGVFSIQLCELVNDGFDVYGDADWDSLEWYLSAAEKEAGKPVAESAQKARFERMFKRHFWFYEIGIMPPGQWRWELTRLVGERLPAYESLYKLVEDGVSPANEYDDFGKERRVYSDFPATQLDNETQDYAANANDYQFEHIRIGNVVDTFESVAKRYNDVDVMLINDCEVLFSCLMSVNMNAL